MLIFQFNICYTVPEYLKENRNLIIKDFFEYEEFPSISHSLQLYALSSHDPSFSLLIGSQNLSFLDGIKWFVRNIGCKVHTWHNSDFSLSNIQYHKKLMSKLHK
jgi:hypothetical protein